MHENSEIRKCILMRIGVCEAFYCEQVFFFLNESLTKVKWCMQNCLIYSFDPVGAFSVETYIVVYEIFFFLFYFNFIFCLIG